MKLQPKLFTFQYKCTSNFVHKEMDCNVYRNSSIPCVSEITSVHLPQSIYYVMNYNTMVSGIEWNLKNLSCNVCFKHKKPKIPIFFYKELFTNGTEPIIQHVCIRDKAVIWSTFDQRIFTKLSSTWFIRYCNV